MNKIVLVTMFITLMTLLTPTGLTEKPGFMEKLEPELRKSILLGRQENLRVVILFKESIPRLDDINIIHRFHSVPAVVAYVSPKKLEGMDLSSVEKIVLDRKVRSFRSESIPLIRVDDVHSLGYDGSGVNVSIVDTGIYNHSEFIDPNRIILQKCYCCDNPPFCDDDDPGCCPDGTAVDDDASDDEGHGTHCAGISAGELGVANGSSLIAVKVLDSSGSGYDSDIAKGIEWAFQNRANVISLSLGGCINASVPDCYDKCYDSITSRMVESAIGNGTVVVAAVGNCGPNPDPSCVESGYYTTSWPSCAKGVIAVGATDDNDEIAPFSSRGPTDYDNRTKPDLTAPGVSINSTVNSTNGYEVMSGTSQAAPHVAGVAALLMEEFNQTFGYFPEPGRVKAILLTSVNTTRMREDGYDQRNNVYGSGRIDAYEAIRILNFTKNRTISEGEEHLFKINVTSNTFKTTLYWPEGMDKSNDLDLIVGNSTHNFSFSTDPNDTVEQVFLDAGVGVWNVFVEGVNVSGDQEYYLASNMEIVEDMTPPALVLVEPENKTYDRRTDLPLNFTTDETNHTIWYTVDGENRTVITGNTTFNVSSDGPHNITLYVNDSYNNINQTTEYFSVDTLPPTITIISPGENETLNRTTVWFNISLNEEGNVTLFSIDGGGNNTMARLNSTHFYNLSILTEGYHNVTFYSNDSLGLMNSSSVNFSVMVKPNITNYRVNPSLITLHETVNITTDITDENLDHAWVNITWPDGVSDLRDMEDSCYYEFNETNQTGTFNVTILANDTFKNENNVSLSFEVAEPINISFNVTTDGTTPENITMKVFWNRTEQVRDQISNSSINILLPKGFWDFRLNASEVNITLEDVNISSNSTSQILLDENVSTENISNTSMSFIKVVVVELDLNFTRATLFIPYSVDLVGDLGAFECSGWNFTSDDCDSVWLNITENTTFLNNVSSINVSGFSAYAITEACIQSCGSWSSCVDGQESRTCVRSNCSSYVETQSCSASGGVSGGGGGITRRIELVAPELIEITQGEEESFDIIVENKGSILSNLLANITLDPGVDGLDCSVSPSIVDLGRNENKSFLVEIKASENVAPGEYTLSFTVKDRFISKTVNITLDVKERIVPPLEERKEESVCGNGMCEEGENRENCCLDCECPEGMECKGNVCVERVVEKVEQPTNWFVLIPVFLMVCVIAWWFRSLRKVRDEEEEFRKLKEKWRGRLG